MKVCSVCKGRHDDSVTCEVDFTSQSLESRENEPQVPGFRLDYLLSSAHHAETYRARDVASGRTCLIKIVAADEASARQAIREAKIAAGLFHPSIANYYDSGCLEDGRCFFVFEDVDGQSLREILDNGGQADLLDTVDIIRQAAEALHTLHRSGLIHGAVSPRNIILSMFASGQAIVRVTDPDLGRLAQRSIISNRFLIDNELDSLRYFSPEQCNGEDATVQTDVYSLGIVFYEMLAGVTPFQATTAVGLIQQHMNQLPPDIRIENFNLRMLVTHALTEALQKQARLRQPSINTLARQLRHIEQLATHSSTPPPAGMTEASAIVPAMAETAIPKASSPVMPSAKVDSYQASEWAPEIITEPRTAEIIRNESITAGSPVTAERPRMVNAEDALEESYATLSNLVTPPPQRPSILQACKTTLLAMTSGSTPPPAVNVPEESPVITPAMPAALTPKVSPLMPPEKIDFYQQASEWAPEITTEPKADESIRNEAITVDAPVTAGRPRMVNAEEALEASYATLSNLVTPPPQRPSILQACKTTLHAMTSLISFKKVEDNESQAQRAEIDDASVSLNSTETALRVPKKIEWVQPDDDIPSIDDVQAVLAMEMAMPVPVVEAASEPVTMSALRPEIESAPRVAKKIAWIQPDDDLPSIDDVQAVLAMEQKVPVSVPVVEREVEPTVVPEPEIAETWVPEPQIIHVEPERVVIVAEAEPSEPQELVVEPPQPEPEVIHVESAVEPQEIVVESPQPEPEVIHVESAVEPQEIVVESPQPEPEVIYVESAEEVVVPVAVSAAPKRLKKSSSRKSAKVVVESPSAEPEVAVVFDAQEVVVEPQQPEPEVVHAESAVFETQEIIVEPQQREPEVVLAESATSEPQEIVVEPQQAEPVVVEVEPEPKAPEIVAAPTLRSRSPKVVLARLQRAVAAVRKRHKKLARKQPVEQVVEPPQLHVEPAAHESEVIQVEPVVAVPQELVVEPQPAEPQVIQVESSASESQELIVEAPQFEPEAIQVESATPDSKDVVVESPEREPVVIAVAPTLRPEPPKGVAALKQFALDAVQKRQKKSRKQPAESLVEPQQPEPQVIHVEPAVSEAHEFVVEPQQSESQALHLEPAVSVVQELVVEPPQHESEVIQVESAVSEPEELIFKLHRPAPQVIHVEPGVSEPQELVVEPQQPEPEVTHTEPATPTQSAFATVLRRHKKSSRRQPVVLATPVRADDEEITVVRARTKRVRIHVTPPVPQRKSRPTIQRRSPAPVEIAFVPTLLGGGIEPGFSIPEQSDAMFAAYSAESSGPILRHRSHLIGGGIIALLALVLFGNDVLTGYFHSWSSPDSMTAEALRPEQPKVLRSSTTTPVVSKPIIADKPTVDKKDRTSPKTRDRVSSETTTSIPHESLKKMMILLPSRATQVEAMSQSDAPPPKRKASGTSAPPEQTVTRPRIVKDSKP